MTETPYRHCCRRAGLPVLVPFLLLSTLFAPVTLPAGDDVSPGAHLEAAAVALKQQDYREAVEQYLKAANLSPDPAVARRATRVAYTFGFDREALAAALRWCELDDKDREAYLYVAQLQLRAGELRKARRSFAAMLELADKPRAEQLLELVAILGQEDAKDGLWVIERLARSERKSALARYAVGLMALHAGDNKLALAEAEAAAELKPGWIKPRLLTARALMASGDAEAAIDHAARIVGDDPDPSPEARLELAIIYMSAGRDDDALSQVNQVLLEQPSRADALRLMAIINFRQQHLDAARADFQDLWASGQYTMDAMYYLARIADYEGETERAFSLYSEINYGSHVVMSQRRAASILAHDKGLERATTHLDEFGRQHPRYAMDMLLAKAQLYASEQALEESFAVYERLLEYRPDDFRVVLGRSEVMLRMGKVEEALAEYRRAVKRWPDNAMALNALGYTLTYHGDDYREAEKLIRRALQLEPDSAAIIDSYGWVLYRLGKPEEALVELEKAWSRLRDPEVGAHIVEVLVKLGRCEEASDVYADAAVVNDEHPMLKEAAELLGTCGD